MNNFNLPTSKSLMSLAFKLEAQLTAGKMLVPQLCTIALVIACTFFLTRLCKNKSKLVEHVFKFIRKHMDIPFAVSTFLAPIILLMTSSFAALIFHFSQLDTYYLGPFVLLAATWLILKLMQCIIGNGYVYKVAKVIIIIALIGNVTGVLNETISILDSFSFQWKEKSISLFFVLKAFFLLFTLFSSVFFILRIVEKNIARVNALNPSMKVIVNKFAKVGLLTFAFLLSLDVIGIDLTALTVFSGAVGIGLGFGLQKIFSNFISGVILLSDRSIKPGDVIGIGNTYGWVNTLGARYVSIITRDGKEHLIPNETLITNQVENWSFSNTDVRIRIPLRISYNTDIHQALNLIVGTANKIPRILIDPEPKCLVRSFGPYAIELELRIWISDPAAGMGSIQSEILVGVLDAFKAHHIEIPIQVYDVNIKQTEEKLVRD